MNIRSLHKDDLDRLLALYEQLNPADLPLPPRPQVDAMWADVCANPAWRYFGGFLVGEMVATCTLAVIPNFTRACQPYGLIENVVTDAAHRNKGYGKALLTHALDDAWAAGCYKVMLMTGRKDAATLQFYKSAGFDSREKQAFIVKR